MSEGRGGRNKRSGARGSSTTGTAASGCASCIAGKVTLGCVTCATVPWHRSHNEQVCEEPAGALLGSAVEPWQGMALAVSSAGALVADEGRPDITIGIITDAKPRTGRSAIAIQSRAAVKRRDKRNM